MTLNIFIKSSLKINNIKKFKYRGSSTRMFLLILDSVYSKMLNRYFAKPGAYNVRNFRLITVNLEYDF